MNETKKILRKALELAARDYYRGCRLVPDQEAELLQVVINKWLVEADDSNTE